MLTVSWRGTPSQQFPPELLRASGQDTVLMKIFMPGCNLRYCQEHSFTENPLGAPRIDSPSSRVKERTVGRKEKSSVAPPCEQALRFLLNFNESVIED